MAFARTTDAPRPMSDLNTTPLIDVLLVLIIMLILTIPPQTHKVALALPSAPADARLKLDPVRNRITVDGAGTIAWNGKTVTRAGLRAYLAAAMRLPLEPALDLVPAPEVRYDVVDGVIADIKHAGVTKLGLPGNEAYGLF